MVLSPLKTADNNNSYFLYNCQRSSSLHKQVRMSMEHNYDFRAWRRILFLLLQYPHNIVILWSRNGKSDGGHDISVTVEQQTDIGLVLARETKWGWVGGC